MTVIDIVIVICIVIGAGAGFAKGLIGQAAAIVGLVLGFIVAGHLYHHVAEEYVYPITQLPPTTAQITAFVGIWIIILIALSLVGALLTRVINAVALGCFNRILGAALGAIMYFFIIGVGLHALDYFDTKSSWLSKSKKEASAFYYPLKDFVGTVFPVIKTVFQGKVIFEQPQDNEDSARRV
jgi:membrane protein required for colicin V production